MNVTQDSKQSNIIKANYLNKDYTTTRSITTNKLPSVKESQHM